MSCGATILPSSTVCDRNSSRKYVFVQIGFSVLVVKICRLEDACVYA